MGTRCENFRVGASGVTVDLVAGEQRTTVEAEALLSAIGVEPNLDGLLGAGVSLALDRGYIKVGADYQTSLPGIYAAGDIIGPPWLAHVATYEAVNAVEGLCGHAAPKRVRELLTNCLAKDRRQRLHVKVVHRAVP